MKKFTKTFVAAILCCSLTMATPLLAQDDTNRGTTQTMHHDDDDNIGKWGLAGLLGLLGLLGLRKRDDDRTRVVTRNP